MNSFETRSLSKISLYGIAYRYSCLQFLLFFVARSAKTELVVFSFKSPAIPLPRLPNGMFLISDREASRKGLLGHFFWALILTLSYFLTNFIGVSYFLIFQKSFLKLYCLTDSQLKINYCKSSLKPSKAEQESKDAPNCRSTGYMWINILIIPYYLRDNRNFCSSF